jgi:1-acyl-sn-glycerol-3-phosphate acyltransferase
MNIKAWMRIFKCKVCYLNPSNRDKVRQLKKAFVFSNHRSWADFFICLDTATTGNTGFLSRAAVGFLLPIPFLFGVFIERCAIVFKRGSKRSNAKMKLFSAIRRFLERGGALLVFPEGHRYQGDGVLTLKWGIICWAYENQYPCAVVLQHGADLIVNERLMKLNRGKRILCDHRGVFYPDDFANKQAFYDRISEEFSLGYKQLCLHAKRLENEEIDENKH